jgi:hypothetical protein
MKMRIATTETLATIVDSEGEQQPITATLESLEGIARWVLRCGGEDANTGEWDTLRACLESARQSWEGGDWQYETTEVGAEVAYA